MRLVTEILLYAAFAVVVGALSVWPNYELVDGDTAIISIVFSHPGERVGECRQLSQEELNKLPPNMRKPADCPRERHAVRVELRSGGDLLYGQTILPSGIWADGKSSVYQRVEVPAGIHNLFVGMSDSGRSEGFDYSTSKSIDLRSGRNLVVQFDEELRTFLIR